MRSSLFHSFLLVLTALIWGAAFLAQKLGADHIGPYAFIVGRSILGGLSLLLVLAFRRPANTPAIPTARSVLAGFWCGLALFVASLLQQVGIAYTTPGISGFLTANYVLLVPILGLFLGTRPRFYVWIGAALSLVGLYFICVDGAIAIGKGEAYTLLCALGFAIQILVVAHFVQRCDVLVMSCAQFFTGALLGLPFLLLPSESTLLSSSSLRAALPGILFCGVFSSGIAYTLQNIAQGRVAPALASILMSLESVFALLFGWLIRHDVTTPRQLSGCALVFAAVILTQVCDTRLAPASSRS